MPPDDEDDGEEELDEEPMNSPAVGVRDGIPSEAIADWQGDPITEYKSANNFLHELHALHQHRLMFSSSPSPSPQRHPSFPLQYTQPIAKSIPSLPLEPTRMHMKGAAVHAFVADPMAINEQQSVQQRYIDSNRLLGTVFLSRRRELESDGGHH